MDKYRVSQFLASLCEECSSQRTKITRVDTRAEGFAMRVTCYDCGHTVSWGIKATKRPKLKTQRNRKGQFSST